jgi:DNA-directed RNA polymerase subunit H (RpoH/RPB5)
MSSYNTSTIVDDEVISKSRTNLLDIMKTVGYNVSEYERFSIDEISMMRQSDSLHMVLDKNEPNPETDRRDKIYIWYYLKSSLQVQAINKKVEELFSTEEVLTPNDTLFIITIKDNNSDSHMSELNNLWFRQNRFVILYGIRRLQFNALNHSLVPPHRKLSVDEKNELFKKYPGTENKLKTISRFDPIAQLIGLRPGDVCEIIQSSTMSITSLEYRECDTTILSYK